MKRLLCLLSLIFFIVAFTACDESSTTQSNEYNATSEPEVSSADFNTPEGVVVTYLEGLRDGDFNRMIGTLPDDLPEGLYADKIVDDFIAHLNWLFDHFQSPLSPFEFQSIDILGFIPPELLNEMYATEQNQNNLSNQAERIGANQLVSRVVLFELGGEIYMLMTDLADFDGEWRLTHFGGNIGNLLFIASPHHGIIPPMFLDEFIEGIDLETVIALP